MSLTKEFLFQSQIEKIEALEVMRDFAQLEQETLCEKCNGTGFFMEDIIGDAGEDIGWDKIGERECICDECF